MVATKNRLPAIGALCGVAVMLAGCMPPGPRALLDGRKLLEQGRYPQAIEKLEAAASLLNTNAHAWNYLGLARHRAGQTTNALAAYQKALTLDQNLMEARFNLGCLWLEQNRPDLAREQFTTYTMQRPQAVEGYLKLGTAQYRLRNFVGAEDAFQRALRLSPNHAEALNGLGLAQLQRNRPREAAQRFNEALTRQPDYRPALLNLATVLHRYLNDAPGAVQRYRAYLELKPQAADWDAVNAVAQALEKQLAPPRLPVPPPVTIAATPVVEKNETKPAPPVPSATPASAAVKTSPPPTLARTSPPAPAVVAPPVSPPVAVVTLPPEPVIKTVPDPVPVTPPEVVPSAQPAAAPAPAPVIAAAPKPARRSFFQRLNPFDREPRTTPITVLPSASGGPQSAAARSAEPPKPKVENPSAPPAPAPARAVVSSPTPSSPPARYAYLSPAAPAAGNRAVAERVFAQAAQLQRANRLTEALASYRQAAQTDPTYFEAHYNAGLVAFELRHYRQSLPAWEYALALRPESGDARYNFALALKAAGYPRDAAAELAKVVAANPNEARAHLTLGNLYAEEIGDAARARTHYLKVLELNPRHPQANAIRYWLVAHPP